MKKSILILLLVAIAAIGTQAATKYEINVGGVEVTSDNKNNVTGGDIKGGTVKYDPTNKILTLTNVTITRTGGSNYGVHNRDCAGLTMKFVGTCNITSDKANAIHLDKSTTVSITGTLNANMTDCENFYRGVIYVNDNATVWFQGGGSLNVTGRPKSGEGYGYPSGFEGKGATSNSYLNFSNLKVVVDVISMGIHKFRTVSIHSGDVKIYTANYWSIYDVGNFNLNNGVACVTPSEAYFSEGSFQSTNYYYTHFTDSYGVILNKATFPDDTFRLIKLREYSSYDDTGKYKEEYLTMTQLQNLTSLDVSSLAISDLTGVSLLTYLTELNCSGCTRLTWLPSLPNSLQTLNCSSINLTKLPTLPSNLKTLNCSNNQLTSLGTLPNSLQTIDCRSNKLSGTLSITGRSALKYLNVSSNTGLTTLNCYSNALTSLYVGGCTALTTLNCYSNQLTSLGVSTCTALTTLNCYSNALTSLDVSGCSALTTLYCYGNQLTSLGTLPNSLQTLICSNNKFSGTLTITGRSALKSLTVSNNFSLTTLSCYNNALTILNADNCSALTTLNCYSNALTSLNVSNCSALTTLDCKSNQLTSLGTLPNSLQTINCSSNKLSGTLSITGRSALKTLNVSSNTGLTTLNCYSNALTSLDVSGCSALTTLDCKSNQLPSFGTLPTSLQTIDCSSNKFSGTLTITGRSALKTLNASNNTSLTTLNAASNALTSLDVSGCSALTTLDCSYNQLTSMGTLPTSLQTIKCSANKFTSLTITGRSALKSLTVSNNFSLTTLNCYSNALTSLNVNNCSALTTLNCYSNALTYLNLTACHSLVDVECYRNELTALNVQGLSSMQKVNAFSNNLTSLDVQDCSALNWLNIRANKIKESAMASLISTMRSIPASEEMGTFYVYGENYSGDKPEGNVITDSQVREVRAKRWLPSHKVGNDWVEITVSDGVRGDLNGDGEVDVSDVNIIIDMVLGKRDKDFTLANLNGDNDVDVSDVSILIDIVLGKG